jgi:hypothetical protein
MERRFRSLTLAGLTYLSTSLASPLVAAQVITAPEVGPIYIEVTGLCTPDRRSLFVRRSDLYPRDYPAYITTFQGEDDDREAVVLYESKDAIPRPTEFRDVITNRAGYYFDGVDGDTGTPYPLPTGPIAVRIRPVIEETHDPVNNRYNVLLGDPIATTLGRIVCRQDDRSIT